MEKFKVIRRGGLENPYAKEIDKIVEAEDLLAANTIVVKNYGQEYVAIPVDNAKLSN